MRPLQRVRSVRSAVKLMSLLSLTVMLATAQPVARSGQHEKHDVAQMKAEHNQHIVSLPNAVTDTKRLADKRESEANHHLAGVLVVLAGLLVLLGGRFKGTPRVRQFWPICLLIGGVFLLVFSDTEIWPFGSQTPWYAITHEAEDLQHKIFALILLMLGVVEYQRAKGRWLTPFTAWIFPGVGLVGTLLLLFHSHSGEAHDGAGMKLMAHIQVQHSWYAVVGAGVVLAKGMSEVRTRHQSVFGSIWPIFLVILGVSLVLYTE